MTSGVADNRKSHVLLVPSEEYLPPHSHLAGIFQHHQAVALREAGYRVGILSVRQAYSIPMIARGALMRAIGRRVHNPLDAMTEFDMARLLYHKLISHKRFLSIEERAEGPVVRAEGFYFLRPSDSTNHFGWVRAGMAAFEEYRRRYGTPDLLHAHNTNPAGMLAARIARRAAIPYLITEHSTFFQRGLVPASLYPKLARAIRGARHLAVVSPSLGETLVKELGECARDAVWVPNVVEPEVIRRSPVEPTRDGEFIFLALGNLIPVKNHTQLIDAFARAFKDDSAVKLRIGGHGPLREPLAQQADALGIGARVELLGELGRGQVIRELDGCHALVLPSIEETFGVVAIEALARGRPVVATRCGGPEHVITREDGLVVAKDDIERLTGALRSMRSNYDSYDRLAIRRRAVERFSPASLVANLERLYDDARSSRD